MTKICTLCERSDRHRFPTAAPSDPVHVFWMPKMMSANYHGSKVSHKRLLTQTRGMKESIVCSGRSFQILARLSDSIPRVVLKPIFTTDAERVPSYRASI